MATCKTDKVKIVTAFNACDLQNSVDALLTTLNVGTISIKSIQYQVNNGIYSVLFFYVELE